jgi:hypothetical protein
MTTFLFPPFVTGGMDNRRIRPRITGAESCFFGGKSGNILTTLYPEKSPLFFPFFSEPYFTAINAFRAETGTGASRTFVPEPKSIRSGNSIRALAGRNFSNTQKGTAARIPAVSQTLFSKKTNYEQASKLSFKYIPGWLYMRDQQKQEAVNRQPGQR